ncbi:MAG: hypothetical protein FWG25_00525 [Promicromonosporaceae bacterium]|nr:hypothetical protein [Promicromonosporaceae bacterium]
MALTVAQKLQIKAGPVVILGLPHGVDLELPPEISTTTDAEAAAVVIAFIKNEAEVDKVATPAITAARADKLAWIAYPKAGKLGTNLNRDSLARLAEERGATPVRQVAIDDTWSALRFKPGGGETRWSPKAG